MRHSSSKNLRPPLQFLRRQACLSIWDLDDQHMNVQRAKPVQSLISAVNQSTQAGYSAG